MLLYSWPFVPALVLASFLLEILMLKSYGYGEIIVSKIEGLNFAPNLSNIRF